MKGESLLQILEVIYDMFIDLMSHLDKKLPGSAGMPSFSLLPGAEKDIDDSISPDEKYSNLEKLLQKYEAQIRDHIRVEQQLKIYVESLQESFIEKENNLKDAVNAAKKALTDVENRATRLEQRLNDVHTENRILKDLLKGLHSSIPVTTMKTHQNMRDSQESIRERDSLMIRADVLNKKPDIQRSNTRAKSREVSPIPANKSAQSKKKHQYLSVMEQSMKGKKGIPKNLLLNFKKIYSKARTDSAAKQPATKDFSKTEAKEKEPIVKN